MEQRAIYNRPLVLYSTNTLLAWKVAEHYYRRIHWVWCSPFFRPDRTVSELEMPPTAVPGEIYDTLVRHVQADDRHSAVVQQNKIGILKGALSKLRARVITKAQHAEIAELVSLAGPVHFRPRLYVIPFCLVAKLVKAVPLAQRANPLSTEYHVEALPSSLFDVIETVRI